MLKRYVNAKGDLTGARLNGFYTSANHASAVLGLSDQDAVCALALQDDVLEYDSAFPPSSIGDGLPTGEYIVPWNWVQARVRASEFAEKRVDRLAMEDNKAVERAGGEHAL